MKVVATAVRHSLAARAFFAGVAPIASADGVSSRAEQEWQPYGRAMVGRCRLKPADTRVESSLVS